MTVITTIAQRILDENNYTIADCSLVNLENRIDTGIRYINLEADTSIAALSGAAGAKTLTASDSEVAVVFFLSGLLLRARQDKGPNSNTGSISVSSITSDPSFTIETKLLETAINRLRKRTFQRA